MTDAWRLQIEIVELRRAFESVMDHLEEASGATIEVPQDFFWSVPGYAIFEVTERPELTIGQLTESWRFRHFDRCQNVATGRFRGLQRPY